MNTKGRLKQCRLDEHRDYAADIMMELVGVKQIRHLRKAWWDGAKDDVKDFDVS